MKDYGKNSSGGKARLGETECQMPKQNARENNLMAGKRKNASMSVVEQGYTGGEKIGGGEVRHDLKLR